MGTTKLWLPSRRSTLHQAGAVSMWSFRVHSYTCPGSTGGG